MLGKVDKSVHAKALAELETALEQFNAATLAKDELAAQVEILTSERDSANSSLEAAHSKIAEHEATIASLQEKLSQRPGAEASYVAPKTEVIVTDPEFQVEVDPITEYAKSVE